MARTFLIFDFDGDEEAAQRARHTVDGWKQAFRLDKKLLLKFDRPEADENKGDKKQDSEANPVRLIVRLDFSDHEKLSHQRWLERIPGEEHFKAAKPKIIRQGDPDFDATAEHFDSLD
jgi:hypothetical protein